MARDPRRTLQTLSGYFYRYEKELRRRDVITAFRTAELPERIGILIGLILFALMSGFLLFLKGK